MNVVIKKDYQEDDVLRKSFNELAEKTFGLNFENWYRDGYWTSRYVPYSVISDNKVISNISVNRMDFEYNNEIRHYIQLGTVMTEKEYRKQGYSRRIMEVILKEYAQYDGIYLYANDNVLEFYPRFGFIAAKEYQYYTTVKLTGERKVEQVPMKTKKDWEYFLEEKRKRNSLGLAAMKNDGLLMFYLTQFMQDNVFYIAKLDAYVIAEVKEDTLGLFDIFAKGQISVRDVWEEFGKEIKKVIFSFTPQDTTGLIRFEVPVENNTFFILGNKLKTDMREINSFPELSHA
ncbi:GNAT family N-acetyltransferase [Anaerocolumna sp. MB42-C2]|uniref:GNAT family N-acetyltransferase n=1 Tax=Anaerocolumna sp. MB42-C2 TaxID=3070997 RepID=UPI0027E1ED6B|nr:GNAT family N-acetyltransferase [Anaerocolumna sp. MB42-C2]WMJ90322.1 GNAT family N-acetyltransferase [Anaerocolumna sp. MB42-C2]